MMLKNEINWCQGEIYTDAVKTIFESVVLNPTYFEWKKCYTYIHGFFDTQRKIDIQYLENIFDIPLGPSQEELFKLIYSIETYYSIILRIIAHKAIFGSIQYTKEVFEDKIYIAKGILNYSCVNYYNWFFDLSRAEGLVKDVYDAVNLEDVEIEGDAISTIFEYIFPKVLRHSVGEYYTPYWLANTVIDQLIINDESAPSKKYIDPACGSATFLVALINKFRTLSNNAIFSNICGIDINPLTVLAAKTNFLILYNKYCNLTSENPIEIPIYCADTIAINDTPILLTEKNNYDNVPCIKYDYIVGNPPWVNWEYMPEKYRIQHAQLWQYYGLFPKKGLNSNFIKEDISVLLTYVAMDKYLKNGGKIGFLVKETLFKSIKQGAGFRKFKIIPKEIDLRVLRVDDLTKIKPFKDAVTRTTIIYIEKGKKTNYPVDYVIWNPSSKVRSFGNNGIFMLSEYIDFETLKARPSINGDISSGWITETEDEMKYSKYILGNNRLVARTGVFTGGANGIFWLNIDSDQNETVWVTNITESAKNKMKKVHLEIEKEYVFPFLTGKDLGFWSYAYSKYILCPHTCETRMYPIDRSRLAKYPLTERYFSEFRKELEDRKGFTSMDESIHKQYFYTLQRIGSYTFAKYKVCWKYISKTFIPAVVEYANDNYLGEKNIIGNEKIISIAFENRDEAYYVCAVISSTPYRKTIENYMVGTQITPSIISRLNIPKFDRENEQHLELSRLCREGHFSKNAKKDYIEQIDAIIKNNLDRK